MSRRLILLAMAAVMALPVAACGRKGLPVPPEGAVYPRQYPDITPPERVRTQPAPGTEQQ